MKQFHTTFHVSVMKRGGNANILFNERERSRTGKHSHKQIPVSWNVRSGVFTFTLAYYLPHRCKLYFSCGPLTKDLVFVGPGLVWKWYLYCFTHISVWPCSNSIADNKTVLPVNSCCFLNNMPRISNGKLNLCAWRE